MHYIRSVSALVLTLACSNTAYSQYGGYDKDPYEEKKSNPYQKEKAQKKQVTKSTDFQDRGQERLDTDLSINKIGLTSGTLPRGLLANSPDDIQTGLQGTIDLVNRSEGRIVIGDQSVQLSPETELTTEKARRLYGIGNLKKGMTVRVDTEFTDGKMEAIAVHELNIPNKRKGYGQKKRKKNKNKQNKKKNNSYGGY